MEVPLTFLLFLNKVCPHLSWPMMFYFFGCIGLMWAVVWIVIFRDEPPDVDPQLLLNPTVSIQHCHWDPKESVCLFVWLVGFLVSWGWGINCLPWKSNCFLEEQTHLNPVVFTYHPTKLWKSLRKSCQVWRFKCRKFPESKPIFPCSDERIENLPEYGIFFPIMLNVILNPSLIVVQNLPDC